MSELVTDKLCRNCEFWGDPREVVNIPDANVCRRPKMFWDATEWRDVGDDCLRVLKDEAKDDLMFVNDGSSYHAALITKGDFFCALFAAAALESKQPAQP